MKNNNKVSVITLGCSKNTVDSERLMRQIQLNNIAMTEQPEEAGTVIINTCGFIDAAKEESVNTILNAVALKNEGYLIITAWGDEASDPDVINERMN